MWLLAYFRQIYQGKVDVTEAAGVTVIPLTQEKVLAESLHLAWSRDGRVWTALNDNRPVWPNPPTAHRVRDPFVARGPADGFFHLVATGGDKKRGCLYARSRDLLDWEPPRSLPLMESVPQVRNVWAPEWVWDPEQENYFVFWSSSSGEHGWDDSRIWCARTADWETWTPPQVLFDPGYTVIDATITRHEGTFYLFFKDERFGHKHGGEFRFIKVATAPVLDGPYTVATEAVTPSITEGPAVFRPNGDYGPWLLLCDHCMDNRYGAFASEDLLRWQPVGDAVFPPEARHGSVFAVTEDEFPALVQRLGSNGGEAEVRP
jgi:hypothetical protein